MASAFGHALVAVALGASFKKSLRIWKFWTIGIACSILPDVDVISFSFGIPYESFWGHRGFSHSLLFAFIIGITMTILFFPNKLKKFSGTLLIFYFSLCTALHGVIDAMTSGGLGCAFFSPWDNSRYFLPWRPIKVSPIGVENFFSEWGQMVLASEAIWIGIPCVLFILLIQIINKRRIDKTH